MQWFGAIAHGLCHAYMLIFPAILLIMVSDLSADLFRVGVLGNVAYFAFGFGAIPAGYLASRFSSRTVVLTFLYGAAITAVALSFLPSIQALYAGFLLLGLFCSLYHPAGLSIIATIKDRGPAMAYHGVSGNLAIAFAPLLFGTVGMYGGWRGAYRVAGIAGIALAFLAHRITFDMPHEERPSAEKQGGRFAEEGRGIHLALLYLIVALNGFIYRGVLTFLPSWFAEAGGSNLAQAGLVTSLALTLGIAGQVFGGRVYRTGFPERSLLFLGIVALPLLAWIGRLPLATSGVIAAAFLFVHFATQPVTNSLVAQYTRSGKRSIGYGFSFFLGFGTGSFASSASGYVARNDGIAAVFPFLAWFAAGIVVIGSILAVRAGLHPHVSK
ncbi:MAG: MFS transporter [Gemmatimonadetes bacterium]|nr:MFS transporter [Gemmatimonadota bacterium]